MLAGLNRIGLLALCLAPALAFGARIPGALPVATYISACGGSGQSPTVTKTFVTAHHPPARPRFAQVELYADNTPARAYEPVGSVLVLTHVSGTGGELTDIAIRAAREMGGDALVSIQIDDAASLRPPAGPVGRLGLRASVVRWSDRANAQ